MLRRRRYARDRDRLTRLTPPIFRRGPPPVARPLVTYARWARLYHLRSGLCRSIPAQCLLPLTRTGRTFKAQRRDRGTQCATDERAGDAPKGALGTGG